MTRSKNAPRPGESIPAWYARILPKCGHGKPYQFVEFKTRPGGSHQHFEGMLLGMGTSWGVCDQPPTEVKP